MLLRVFLIYSIFLVFKIFAEREYCEPADEFKTEKNSKIWEQFMEMLGKFTFVNDYSKRCENDPSKTVTIDANGDFLWNLRFKLYNETISKENHTLQDCYSVGNNANEKKCDTEKFQKCMFTVRDKMITNLIGFWESDIQKELEKLAKDC